MVQPHRVAVEEVVAGVDHAARSRRDHRRALGRSDVHAAVRVARLAVEHPPQPERTRTRARRGLAQQQRGRQRLAERRAHLREVRALPLVTREVVLRQIDLAGRDGEALLGVVKRLDRERQAGARAVAALHLERCRAGLRGERDADDGRPLRAIGYDHHRDAIEVRARCVGGCAERDVRDAAGREALLRQIACACRRADQAQRDAGEASSERIDVGHAPSLTCPSAAPACAPACPTARASRHRPP